jgi:hypothetical protein
MEMREIIVTVTDKEGTVLDRHELTWDEKRFPATHVEIIPHTLGSPSFFAIHPSQSTLAIGN